MKYTLAFDVYGTLINTSGVFNTLEEMIGEKAKIFMDSWRNKQLEYSFRRGLMNQFVDFSICTQNALDYCCQAFAVDLSSRQKETLLHEYTILPTFPDVKTGLQNLKEAGHSLYAFSNGSKNTISTLLINAEIRDLFNGIVSVEDVKVFKPSPLVYEHFNTETNSTPSNSWLISSNPFDVIGAISYGMRSAWVQRTPDSLFDPWGIEPSLTIKKITDLKDQLEKIE
ncbi:haloacid dehalogenase type II [Flavobacterium sp. WC2430]|uniref:haloacid dehalogenase type II n=1 Tax=Flavobacterium sp. WC2430 TaxID=3234137 RepID=UPI003466BE7C